jgi:trehalose-6-phosphate synthase
MATETEDKRLIVVANRLPVTISKDEKGEYKFKVSFLPFDNTRFPPPSFSPADAHA